jgi:hypothetical protein
VRVCFPTIPFLISSAFTHRRLVPPAACPTGSFLPLFVFGGYSGIQWCVSRYSIPRHLVSFWRFLLVCPEEAGSAVHMYLCPGTGAYAVYVPALLSFFLPYCLSCSLDGGMSGADRYTYSTPRPYPSWWDRGREWRGGGVRSEGGDRRAKLGPRVGTLTASGTARPNRALAIVLNGIAFGVEWSRALNAHPPCPRSSDASPSFSFALDSGRWQYLILPHSRLLF